MPRYRHASQGHLLVRAGCQLRRQRHVAAAIQRCQRLAGSSGFCAVGGWAASLAAATLRS
jgi:hypothetical protein